MQVTAQSLLGRFGKSAQECSQRWLADGAVHFIASDAHNVTSRPLRLKETFDWVAKMHGEDVARALLVDNPRAAFEGQPLPFVPEISEDGSRKSDSRGSRARGKKRFWFF